MPHVSRHLLLVLAAVAAAGIASAQRAVKLPAVEDSELPNLVRVVAPAARCMAVSDAHGLIAVGHHAKGADALVTLFKLGPDGAPAGDPVRLTHPRPAALEKIPATALSVVFHPSLPLLYVWQDLDQPSIPVPLVRKWRTDPAELAAFDHLLVYLLDGPAPKLLASLCRGGLAFGHGRPFGSVAVDGAHGRLYVPNVDPATRGDQQVVGCYYLDAQGLPVVGKDAPDPAAKAAAFDLTAAEAAAKRIAEAHAAGKAVPPQRTPQPSPEAFPGLPNSSAGIGFAPVGKDTVLFGGHHDVVMATWSPEDRRAKLAPLQTPASYRYHALTAHPRLPVVYAVGLNHWIVTRVEHQIGHMTLAPQTVEVTGPQPYLYSPAVVTKDNKLAVGGWYHLHLIGLDADGRFKPERTSVKLEVKQVEAVGYSEKFDRLYVGVDPPKEKK